MLAKMLKTEVLGEKKIVYMKLIKIQSCHMGVIFTPNHMTWQRQQCVQTHSLFMRYHTGNVYLRCCDQCPKINIPDQEKYDKHPNPSPSIFLNIYHLIALCTKHGKLLVTDKKRFYECQYDTALVQSEKIYTRKEIVMMETTISNFQFF